MQPLLAHGELRLVDLDGLVVDEGVLREHVLLRDDDEHIALGVVEHRGDRVARALDRVRVVPHRVALRDRARLAAKVEGWAVGGREPG